LQPGADGLRSGRQVQCRPALGAVGHAEGPVCADQQQLVRGRGQLQVRRCTCSFVTCDSSQLQPTLSSVPHAACSTWRALVSPWLTGIACGLALWLALSGGANVLALCFPLRWVPNPTQADDNANGAGDACDKGTHAPCASKAGWHIIRCLRPHAQGATRAAVYAIHPEFLLCSFVSQLAAMPPAPWAACP
jgi:hypothetical protein